MADVERGKIEAIGECGEIARQSRNGVLLSRAAWRRRGLTASAQIHRIRAIPRVADRALASTIAKRRSCHARGRGRCARRRLLRSAPGRFRAARMASGWIDVPCPSAMRVTTSREGVSAPLACACCGHGAQQARSPNNPVGRLNRGALPSDARPADGVEPPVGASVAWGRLGAASTAHESRDR